MIKEVFSKLIKKESLQKENKSSEQIEQSRNNFLDSLRVETNNSVIWIAKKIKSKEKSIKELTDRELDEMLVYYKNKLGIKKT